MSARGAGFAQLGVELGRAVPLDGVGLGVAQPFPFFGQRVQNGRSLELTQALEQINQFLHVVTVYRTHVAHPHSVKRVYALRVKKAAGRILSPTQNLGKGAAQAREGLLARALGVLKPRLHLQGSHKFIERAHVLGNAHLVVIEHDNHVFLRKANLVQGGQRHATGEAPVANHGRDFVILSQRISSVSHAQRAGQTGRGVTHGGGVVLALGNLGEARKTAFLANTRHLASPSGQHLVGVSLMAHIEQNTVSRAV